MAHTASSLPFDVKLDQARCDRERVELSRLDRRLASFCSLERAMPWHIATVPIRNS